MALQLQSMELKPSSSFGYPPGFRFHPSDEELITYYLENKAYSRPLPASIIAEIDLYKYNPWDLPNKALFGGDEWYFFTPRDRKYPNGARPNRAAGSGFWKATGTDRPITSASKSIGVKKALVFYAGRPPKGVKTDWIMNEYRLPDSTIKPLRKKGSMRLDDWVLCRVRQKNSMPKTPCGSGGCSPSEELVMSLPGTVEVYPRYTSWDTDIIMDCLNKDDRLLASATPSQAILLPIENISSVSFQGSTSFPPAYDRGSSQLLKSPIMVAYCNNHTPLETKPSAEDGYDGILPSDELNSGNKNKDLYLSKTTLDNELNYHSQVQSLEGFYSANPWDPETSFVELNQLAFAGNIYSTQYSDGYISHR